MPATIFVSSVQKELQAERLAIRDFVRGDPLLRRFFNVFLFEDLPALDRRADAVYLDEVARCAIYVGLFGNDYGSIDTAGVSPTEREFERATALGKQRLIFVKGAGDADRQPKMRALVNRAAGQLIRRRFGSTLELTSALHASLVEHLLKTGDIHDGPFDAAACPDATLDDLSTRKLDIFLGVSNYARRFPLVRGTPMLDVLKHLKLLNNDRPTYAAVMLFGKEPQRFLPTSHIKCARFHGTEIGKPIEAYHIYEGTVFELGDQATEFVMTRLDARVALEDHSVRATTTYEIPRETVREAITNAVGHRHYASNASVQVMLFADRLEVWNPGAFPPTITPDSLREPHPSIPGNRLIAQPLFLAGYIEQMGTGTLDMIKQCKAVGLKPPEFQQAMGQVMQTLWRPMRAAVEEVTPQVTGEVTGEVARLLLIVKGEMKRSELQEALALKHEDHFREAYLLPALGAGLLEMTVPDKPTSRMQKYRLTAKGKAWVIGQ